MAEEVNTASEELEEEQEKTSWLEEHPKAVFWTRFVAWTCFACVFPFMFIIWRFELYKTISKIQIGGWGLIGIVIVAVFVLTVIKYVRLALSAKYSLLGQILGGFCKVILPLLVALCILYSVRDNVNAMIQALGCVVLCEAIAIPLNPLPKWAYEQQKDVRDEEKKEAMDYLLDGFFKRKKDGESGGK